MGLSLFQVIGISFLWMVLVVILFNVFDSSKVGLGIIFWFLLALFVPVIIFVFVNIVCWIYNVNETAYYVVMAVMAGIFIGLPILYFIGKNFLLNVLYPPKRMANYAYKTVGKLKHFEKSRWSSTRYYGNGHSKEQNYIEAQIFAMRQKLGIVYDWRIKPGKKRYIRAIMELNMTQLPQLKGWEYHTVLDGIIKAQTAVLLSFDDGEKAPVYLYWPKRKFTAEELTEEDRKKYSYAKKYWNITMTGRLIYILMCIERYLLVVHPNRDWTPVARRMWSLPKEEGNWSEGTPGNLYREIVPERIMRFYKYGYGYDELNSMVFDKKLSKEDYTELRALYEGISKGDPKEEINQIVGIPEKVIYTVNLRNYDFAIADRLTIESVLKAEGILEKRGIELPNFSLIEKYRFERSSDEMSLKHKEDYFGFGVDATELSMILNRKKRSILNRSSQGQSSPDQGTESKSIATSGTPDQSTADQRSTSMKFTPIRVNNLIIARGHLILWLEKRVLDPDAPKETVKEALIESLMGASIIEKADPGFVYLPGELTMDSKFYVDLNRPWSWIEKPKGSVYFRDDTTVLGMVTDEEKEYIIAAVDQRNKEKNENLQIIFD